MSFSGSKLIYTLGTSTRSPEEFIQLLKSRNVGAVVDVRRFPASRFEHFGADRLAGLLQEAGINYIQMGKELGGYRRGGYRAFTEAGEFHSGINGLEEIARQRSAAIVCAERFSWRCHRRFIAWELEGRGWEVCHIIDEERDWVPGRKGDQ